MAVRKEFEIVENLENIKDQNDDEISGQAVCTLLSFAGGVTAGLLQADAPPGLKIGFIAVSFLGAAGTFYFGGMALKSGDEMSELERELKK